MRTNIEIDQRLMEDVLRLGPFKTKKDAVDAALRLLLQTRRQGDVKALFGKLDWDGDLDRMRLDP